MKKVLLAFDGTQFSEGAFNFARKLNEKQSLLLTGVFIPQTVYANLWSYAGGMAGPSFIPYIEEANSDVVETNIKHFEELCVANGIQYKVHKDFYDFALPELRRETRFADLMILSSEKFYENIVGEDASDYMKDALHMAECPVLVVPEKAGFPKTNLLAYDGTESSVFAIKQFAYLFPEFTANKTTLVYSKESSDAKMPDEEYIEELAQQHFPNIDFKKSRVEPKHFYQKWANDNKNSILVSGSFGRSFLSQIFKKSFVNDVIEAHRIPVFIAHK
jgi:hypothetical protein